MIDDGPKGGAFEATQESWWKVVHDNAHATKCILFLGMWELTFFVQKKLCGSWCNEGCYSLNMSQDGNNKICIKESILILLQLLYIVAKLYTCKSCSIFLQ